MNEPIGLRIKRSREARGWSQRDLAQRVGVSQQTVAHWEQGGTPRRPKQRKIAEVLEWNKQPASGLETPMFSRARIDAPDWGDEADARLVQLQAEEEPPAPPPTIDEHITNMQRRIEEIHREHALNYEAEKLARQKQGLPESVRFYMPMDPLLHRSLRETRERVFMYRLQQLHARGRPFAGVVYGGAERKHDYVSDLVIAEIIALTFNNTSAIMTAQHAITPQRFAWQEIRLAVAKAQRPMIRPMFIMVVEVGDVEEVRALATRLEFDCAALGIALRVVRNYIEAAEAIVNVENVLAHGLELPDTVKAEGTVTTITPGTGRLGIAGYPPGTGPDDPEWGTW